MFEVRRIDADADDSCMSTQIPEQKYLKISDFIVNKDIDAAVIESDEEDLDHSPNLSRKLSSDKYVKKRSSPVCIYTYKVNSLVSTWFTFCFIFIWKINTHEGQALLLVQNPDFDNL